MHYNVFIVAIVDLIFRVILKMWMWMTTVRAWMRLVSTALVQWTPVTRVSVSVQPDSAETNVKHVRLFQNIKRYLFEVIIQYSSFIVYQNCMCFNVVLMHNK